MNQRTIDLRLHTKDGVQDVPFVVRHLVIAGWAGRDNESVQAHIRELQALGVAPPKETPLFYRVSRDQVTTADTIEVVGGASSGEVECVLFVSGADIYVGIGSDHTDRKLETISVTQSKQVCAKPVGRDVWKISDVVDHWDELQMESRLGPDGPIYQSGVTAALRPAMELLTTYKTRFDPDLEGVVMFCGTLAVHGGIRPYPEFAVRLYDPVLERELSHSYTVTLLPDDA